MKIKTPLVLSAQGSVGPLLLWCLAVWAHACPIVGVIWHKWEHRPVLFCNLLDFFPSFFFFCSII